MKLKVSIAKRFKQLLCQHDRNVSWSSCTKGINRKVGHWNVTYKCRECGFSSSEWMKADEVEIEQLFAKDVHIIK